MTIIPFFSAAPETQPFPNVSFKIFSTFIEETFGSKISLATVLLLLFSMTENPELLNLHACQQNPSDSENKILACGWIRALSHTVMHQLEYNTETLFQYKGESQLKQTQQVTKLSKKLDAFATLLGLTHDHSGRFKRTLLPVSYIAIQGVHVICPKQYFLHK